MKSIIIIALAALPFLTFAQVNQDKRIEIEVNSLIEDYYALPAGDKGMILFGESNEIVNKERVWYFSLYDTELKKAWEKTAKVNKKFHYKEHYFEAETNKIYVLFSKYKSEEFELIEVSINQAKVSKKTGFLPKKFRSDQFKVFNNTLYVAGDVRKDYFFGSYNLKTMQLTPFPIPYRGENEITNIETNYSNNNIDAVIANYVEKRGTIFIHSYRGNEKVNELKINSVGDYNLLNGKVNVLDEDEKIVIGTYAIKKGGSSGLYFTKYNGNKKEYIKFYNFSDFENFFSYLPARKQVKIEKKKSRKEAKGKELDLSYRLLVHDLIVQNEQYILIAEAYYPTYRTETYTTTTTDANGNTSTQTHYRQVFDGWRYSHAVVAGFSKNGEKIWSNTFEMGDYKTFNLRERLEVNVDGEEINLIYGTYKYIKTQKIIGGKIVDEKKEHKIETMDEDDKTKRSTISEVEYWYSDYFIAWGYQKIKNSEAKKGERKRKVFYFNKINYN